MRYYQKNLTSPRGWFSGSRNRDSFNDDNYYQKQHRGLDYHYTDSQGPPFPLWNRHSTELQNRPAFVHAVPYAEGHSTEPQNRPAFVQHCQGERH